MDCFFGKKISMTQVFNDKGDAIPVTLIELQKNSILKVVKEKSSGYNALQVGVGENKKEKRKFLTNMWKKNNPTPPFPPSVVKEIPPPILQNQNLTPGAALPLPKSFSIGAFVHAQGTSIGKGFQGVVKRYGMHGGKATHGSHFHRTPGSIGNCSFPGRVHKGKKMAGRMGANKVTIKNLQIINVFPKDNLLLLKGSVPGKKGNLILLKKSTHK